MSRRRTGAKPTLTRTLPFCPILGIPGTVLILSGISMESAEAAGELVGDKDFAKVLTRMIGPQAVSERYFEILLRTSAVGGTVKNSQIVNLPHGTAPRKR